MLSNIASAHEFWIEPETYQTESGGAVNAALVNGQDFSGVSIAYLSRSIVRLEYRSGNALRRITGALGDRPAIQLSDMPDGLLVLGYESRPSKLVYEDWQLFKDFADKKGLEDALGVHTEMGLDPESFTEGYTRFSKSLVQVGSGSGDDQAFGFETEFIALINPYTAGDLQVMSAQLFYQDAPRPDALVEVYQRDGDGVVTKFVLQTDSDGIVEVPVKSGHDYMLDSVVFRPPSNALLERMEVDWETLWANLTFAVPAN